MRISAKADYAVRAALELAVAADDTSLKAEVIAASQGVPHKFLEGILGDLRRGGLVASQRGGKGGYRLARPSAEIAMTDAVRALEGPLLEMPCAGVEDLEHCDRPQPCSVHEVFQRVYESLSATLGGTSLADVAATAGGPPYPVEVRRRRASAHVAAGHPVQSQEAARNA